MLRTSVALVMRDSNYKYVWQVKTMVYVSDATYSELNSFINLNFQMNEFCDNIAYILGYKKMVKSEEIFHSRFAHKFPEFADRISNLMIKLEVRPKRGSLKTEDRDYIDNVEMFKDLKKKIDEFRTSIIKLIDIADINNDVEVRTEMEGFLTDFIPYLNQSNIWLDKAIKYGDNLKDFDKDFSVFTKI